MVFSFSTKVVFPAPPPTSNTLTPHQRSQLMRSAKKLSKVLGTTPHLLDVDCNTTHIPVNFPEDHETHICRASMESFTSCNSSKPLTSLKTTILSHHATAMHRSIKEKDNSFWAIRKPPVLRLSIPPMTSVGNLSPSTASPCDYALPLPINEHHISSMTLPLNRIPSPLPPSPPSSLLPSFNSERRQKVERLRRKLGEELPLNIVFPSSDSLSCSSSDSDSEATYLKSCGLFSEKPKSKLRNRRIPVFSSLGFLKSSRIVSSLRSFPPDNFSNRIYIPANCRNPHVSSANDSKHHSPRSIGVIETQAMVHLHVSQPLTSGKSRITDMPNFMKDGEKSKKEQLCAIMESPNEHSAGCAQEFGIGTRFCKDDPDDSGYSTIDEEDFKFQVQLWSTRRGYGGW